MIANQHTSLFAPYLQRIALRANIAALVLLSTALLQGDDQFELVPTGEPLAGTAVGESGSDTFPPSPELELLDEPAPAYSSGEWIRSGGWYFEEDIVVLNHLRLRCCRRSRLWPIVHRYRYSGSCY